MEDCALILNSGSRSRFAEIDPLRYGIESDGSVDHNAGVDAVDVDSDAAVSVDEEFVHHDLVALGIGDHTCRRVQKLVPPEDVVGEIVETCSKHFTDGLVSLTVGYCSNGLRERSVAGQGGVDHHIVDDRVLGKAEESGVEQRRQRNTHQGSSRWIGGKGDEPRFRIDVALDHGKDTDLWRRIPPEVSGLI
jgi:hypothetical protein